MARHRSATSREISEIGDLLHQLQGRLERLGTSAVADAREAGGALPGMLSETLSDLSDRVRTLVSERTNGMGAQVTRVGSNAWHKVEDEVGHHPIITLALVAGIGFVVGVLGRRH